MKKLLLLVGLLPTILFAQTNNSGVITYAEVTQINWTPPADMDPAMRAQVEEMRKRMPKSFTYYKDLTFAPEFAYYKTAPKQEKIDAENAAQANSEGRGGFRRMMGNTKAIHYWDLKKSKYTEKREFFEREFLIKDDTKKLTWKIMGDAKQIAGYVCQKAVTMEDSNQVVGWFCPTIPVPTGPNGYGQLPGLILELELKQARGTTVITADSIALQAVNASDFEAPKGGKVVTKAEYDQIVDEKVKEMQAEWKSRMGGGGGGGGGTVIIRHE